MPRQAHERIGRGKQLHLVLFKASVVKPTIINGDAGEQKQFPLLNSKIAE